MILIIQGQLPHYRRPVFNELSKYDEVLVVHSGKRARLSSDRFGERILPAKQIGPFWIQPGLSDLIDAEMPSVVIAMFDLRWLCTIEAMFRYDSRLVWIWWGLDRGRSDWANRLKCHLAKRDNPIVFYHELIRSQFQELGLDQKKLFVANNTFYIENSVPGFQYPLKNKFINVGSLDSRKQNDVTIKVFKAVREKAKKDLKLVFVGNGKERENLQTLISREGLENCVFLVNQLDDPEKLKNYYQEAIASVSFGQAGLAVLQSMAFGVPFVTKRNAISGGEKFNILNEENGLFCEDSPESLESTLLKLVTEEAFARKLGEGAYKYYIDKASITSLVSGLLEAKAYGESKRGQDSR